MSGPSPEDQLFRPTYVEVIHYLFIDLVEGSNWVACRAHGVVDYNKTVERKRVTCRNCLRTVVYRHPR